MLIRILALAKDPFASHVCETLFKAATSRIPLRREIHIDGVTTSLENLILYASAVRCRVTSLMCRN